MSSVFISYSHKDQQWYEKVEEYLKQLEASCGIKYFSDRKIIVSEDWNKSILSALEEARCAIFLISGNFLSSAFIQDVEVKRLLNRKKRDGVLIFPLLIQEGIWRQVDWLKSIQVYPTPPKPLNKMRRAEQERSIRIFFDTIINKIKSATTAPSAKKRAKDAATGGQGDDSAPSHSTGFVLMVDIKNFTLINNTLEQKAALDRLWTFLKLQADIAKIATATPTKDGAILFFQDARIQHRKVLELAQRWMTFMQEAGYNIVLRIAVHHGPLGHMTLPYINQPHTFGTALNECEKLCSFSGPGSVIVSEDFLNHWEKAEKADFTNLWPKRGEKPIDIILKEDKQIGVRVLSAPDAEAPQKLAFINTVDDELLTRLEYIEDLFVTFLEDNGLQNARKQASPRISILIPKILYGKKVLASTTFRYHNHPSHIHQGNTYYQIEDPGTGPCGRAFVTKKVQIASELPDFNHNSVKYIEIMERAWGLDAEQVRGFSRMSRAILSIPFGWDEDNPLGVICIDSMHPLKKGSKLTQKMLYTFCEELVLNIGAELSLLWLHRIQ